MKSNDIPAFPTPISPNPNVFQIGHLGMSLRDYFAAKTINGICSNQWYMTAIMENKAVDTTEELAKICYEMANAMLKEREKYND